MNSTASGDRRLERSTGKTEDAIGRTATVCVVGLGYVGLPLAVEFDEVGFDVLGFDVDPQTIGRLSNGVDTTGDIGDDVIEECEVAFTADGSEIADADFVLIAVPTPVDDNDVPSLDYVLAAGETVGKHLTAGTTVVLESTVYPGATREELIPTIEDASGLDCGEEFSIGYSPERASPGDGDHGLRDVVKIVSGLDEDVTEEVAALYEQIVDPGVHRTDSIEVAEAAKVIENVQRDVNIALMNELSMAFDEMGIDTKRVIEAAGTKWNFHEYQPGLVGGHCIPVDPHFFAHRAEREGAVPQLINTSRRINEAMGEHVADLVVEALARRSTPLSETRLLVMGVTYKPDVADVRRSKIDDVVDRITDYGIDVAAFDPHAENADEHFDFEMQDTLSFEGYDGVVLATPHSEFIDLPFATACEVLNDPPAIVDVDGALDPEALPNSAIYRRL